ncbi:hypothetical protein SAMN02910447_03151 [Ruminococcus sp. YE71]|uniref:hypothetical protein n=1 Tax=unclassified Ruminococcus TaxID=2608920 RepID=UPI00087F2507|nr:MULTISPECIES: hypothetical protein [unclassified Ruminococcus]SDA30245.1 hypothetical protein SAMN02910446_03222 [Ruminococcus sp. YE78]SFW49296.1 hypothetical protein SAMN02910447_03151 [Ruminococcus sp. YE71]
MNFFTQELKKICNRSEYIQDPKFVGRVAVFRLPDCVTGKMEFVTRGYADHYSALKISLFNRKEGQIDCQIIDLAELLGMKKMRSGNTVAPHIWRAGSDVSWYGFAPTESDYDKMAETTDDYLSCFTDQDILEDELLNPTFS